MNLICPECGHDNSDYLYWPYDEMKAVCTECDTELDREDER